MKYVVSSPSKMTHVPHPIVVSLASVFGLFDNALTIKCYESGTFTNLHRQRNENMRDSCDVDMYKNIHLVHEL